MSFKIKLKFGGFRPYSGTEYVGRLFKTKSDIVYRIDEYDSDRKIYYMRGMASGKLFSNVAYTQEEIDIFIEDGVWKYVNIGDI